MQIKQAKAVILVRYLQSTKVMGKNSTRPLMVGFVMATDFQTMVVLIINTFVVTER